VLPRLLDERRVAEADLEAITVETLDVATGVEHGAGLVVLPAGVLADRPPLLAHGDELGRGGGGVGRLEPRRRAGRLGLHASALVRQRGGGGGVRRPGLPGLRRGGLPLLARRGGGPARRTGALLRGRGRPRRRGGGGWRRDRRRDGLRLRDT